MNDANSQINRTPATLYAIEGDFAYFQFPDIKDSEEPHFEWPLNKLPEGIQVGDTVHFTINFELAEKRKSELKKQKADENKVDGMRKLLEELVN